MIERISGFFVLTCDVCGHEHERMLGSFEAAKQAKRDNGWVSRKTREGWQDVCPACQEAQNGANSH